MERSWQEEWDKKLGLHEKNKFTDILAVIETFTDIPRLYIVLGTFGLLILLLILANCKHFLGILLAFIYPAYQSIRAIESQAKDDHIICLTYWVVCAAFQVVDFLLDMFTAYIPLYWIAKSAFLIWCWLPIHNNGSRIIYDRLIKPLYQQSHHRIEAAIANTARRFADRAAPQSS